MLNAINSIPYPILRHVIAMWVIALLSLVMIPVLWNARKHKSGGALLLLLAAMGIWNVFSGLEYLSTSLEAKIFWMRLSYIGISFAPSLALLSARIFCVKEPEIYPAVRRILIVVPVITIVLAFTNQYHGLMWRAMAVDPYNNAGLWDFGLWFYLWAGLSYVALAASLFVLLRTIIHNHGATRIQAVLALVAMLSPWITNGFYLFGFDTVSMRGYDLTPMSLGITVIALAINHWVFNFLSRMPVARERVMEEMRQGVIVLDDRYVILDVNQILCTIAQVEKSRILGLPVERAFPQYQGIWDDLLVMDAPRHLEYDFGHIGHLTLDIAPLFDKKGKEDASGWVVLVDDITEQVREEQALQKAHEQLEAKVKALEEARYTIKTLGNLVPICAECGRRAQLDDGTWIEISRFIELHSSSEMTHGICPACVTKLAKGS